MIDQTARVELHNGGYLLSSHVSIVRRMFPTVRASVSGLEPTQHYFVLLDIVLAEESRYKYSGKQWTVAGKAEPQLRPR